MGIKNPSVHHTNGFVLVTDWCGSKSSATNVYFALFSLSDVAQLRGACFAADLLHLGGLVTMSGAYEKMRTLIGEDMRTTK